MKSSGNLEILTSIHSNLTGVPCMHIHSTSVVNNGQNRCNFSIAEVLLNSIEYFVTIVHSGCVTVRVDYKLCLTAYWYTEQVKCNTV